MARSITRDGSTFLLCGCNATDQNKVGGDILEHCFRCVPCGTTAHSVDAAFEHRNCNRADREYLPRNETPND